MKYSLIACALFSTYFTSESMEQFCIRLMDTNRDQIQECDDTDRWISLKHEDFLLLFNNAHQQNIADKTDLQDLEKKILDGHVKATDGQVLLTQKEFFGGLVQYLPWNNKLFFAPNAMPVLLNNQRFLLTLGNNNFWKPNNIRITQQP